MIFGIAILLYVITLILLLLIFGVHGAVATQLLLGFFVVVAANLLHIKIFEKRFNPLSPIFIISVLHLMAYHFSAVYFIFLPTHFPENIVFQFDDHNLVAVGMMIATISFSSVSMGYFLGDTVLPRICFKKTIAHLNFRFSYFLFFGWFTLAIIKLFYLKLGWYGSLAAFTGSVQSAGRFSLITPFFLLVYPYIAYLAIVCCKHKASLNFLLFVIVIEILIAVIAGNRRELISIVLPVITVFYFYGRIHFSIVKFFGAVSGLAVYLITVNIYGRLLGNFQGDLDYFALFAMAGQFMSVYLNDAIALMVAEIFIWLGQLHMIGTVLSMGVVGGDLFTPLQDLSSRFISFDTDVVNVEYEIFQQALYIKGERPYLTNPSVAYLYYLSGISGVILYGFLSGCLLRIILAGLNSKYSALLIIGFLFAICNTPLHSLTGAFVGITKVSTAYLFVIYGLFYVKKRLNHHSLL